MPPPHTAVHIATLDLPRFYVNIMENVPPPRLTIRTDPPPRQTFPTHPEHSPAPFLPTPESGLIVMEVFCQSPNGPDPHYVICLLKTTLLQYLPAPTSPLLFQAFPRPAPVVQWQTLAPRVRMFGPDMTPSCMSFSSFSLHTWSLTNGSAWVCYVYQNRYIYPMENENGDTSLKIYDFDPLRVRKEKCDRANEIQPTSPSPPPQRRTFFRPSPKHNPSFPLDGDHHGLILITAETVLSANGSIRGHETRTGKDLPYMFVERDSEAGIPLLDGERVILAKASRRGHMCEKQLIGRFRLRTNPGTLMRVKG